MPELGKYALVVISAYGTSLVLLFSLIGWSIWQSKRVKAALAASEKRVSEAK
jgi:heme exporter protein D